MKQLFTTLLILMGTMVTMELYAQTDPTNPQIICEGDVKNYQVDYLENGGAGTLGSIYVWTLTTGGFAGTILTNQGPGGSSNRIQIDWGPTAPGDYELTVLETNDGCPGTPVTLTIRIEPRVTPTFNPIGPFCQNATPTVLPGSSIEGITGSWSPAVINTSATGTSTYTFTPDAGQCAVASVSIDVTVDTEITPTFAAFPSICEGGAAPVLPATSANGIAGVWSPSVIDASAAGTSTYTFTPDPGQCAEAVDVDITIDSPNTPTFNPIADICENTTAPILPATSTNGITGTWSPSAIDVSTPGTSTYTFTPSTGQCATNTALDVTITPETIPTFDPIADICENTSAPVLPVSSSNGITGTWFPATIDVSTPGTATYTFTPDAGQCAADATLDVTIIPESTPTFDPIAPICLNGTAPALPSSSLNGITGTWSPAIINVSTPGTSTYTFTPDAGQCAATTTLDVSIDDAVTPVFDPIGPFCQNATPTALPSVSNNGITGTWSPATINTNVNGTTTYTFTPDAGQCALPLSVDILVDNEITPTFAAIASVCLNGTAPVLPDVSANGITGTWIPATVDVGVAGTATYTFTPDAGQCAVPADIDITVNNLPVVTVGPDQSICVGENLTLTATGADTYTWTPSAGLSQDTGSTVIASPASTSTYTVTGVDANGCSNSDNITIIVNPIPNTSPIFHD
jgi:uncharacterized protein YaaQ